MTRRLPAEPSHRPRCVLPREGRDKQELLREMQSRKVGDWRWREGRSFSLVYHAGDEHTEFLKRAYELYFSENGLSRRAFPSLARFEAEVVSMVSALLGGDCGVAGTMTSGGTESILLAIKSYRDRARAERPEISRPEMVLADSAHPAFLKAAQYFDVQPVIVPSGRDYRADPRAMAEAIGPSTVVVVGSAPSFPHGVVDPIAALGAVVRERRAALHVDAALGGIMLPFLRGLGYPVPAFDFRVPEVTSISVDLHKNGFAPKGASVALYRDIALRRFQFFATDRWTGGAFASTGILGTRPGGAIAGAWAALQAMGASGYEKTFASMMRTTRALQEGIAAISGLHVNGEPEMSVFSFSAKGFDVFDVADEMERRGWSLDRLESPDAIHVVVTPAHELHVPPFLLDLEDAVRRARVGASSAPRPRRVRYGITGTALLASDPVTAILDGLDGQTLAPLEAGPRPPEGQPGARACARRVARALRTFDELDAPPFVRAVLAARAASVEGAPFEPSAPAPEQLADAVREASTLAPDRVPADPTRTQRELGLATRALTLAAPTETFLSWGGDSRILRSQQSGRNRYECSSLPALGTSQWSSCSASSPTLAGYRAAEQLRSRLLQATLDGRDLDEELRLVARETKRRILRALQLEGRTDVDVVITPTGTDAELVPLLLAADGRGGRIHNIVVGPSELGRGSTLTAAARHFDRLKPSGGEATVGAPICGPLSGRVHLDTVEIREPSGRPRELRSIESEIRRTAERALSAGERVVVHLVDSSKTGLRAPRPAFVEELARRGGDDLVVAVDAAQMRSRPEEIRRYLESGFTVIATGSKFFGGAPFSGCVLVPASFRDRAPLPPISGLDDYLCRHDLPERGPFWSALRAGLRCPINLALHLRWATAIVEMERYFAVPASERDALTARLAARIREGLLCCPLTRLVEGPEEHGDAAPLTIFPFQLFARARSGEARLLSLPALSLVHAWMARPLSASLPGHLGVAERAAADRMFLLGQPVQIGGAGDGALRIAISAPAITFLAAGCAAPEETERRFGTLSRDLDQLTSKLRLIAEHFEDLTEDELDPLKRIRREALRTGGVSR